MHDAPDTTDPVLEEEHRGCLRIRLYRFVADTGPSFGVEVSAWNSWAGQSKLLAFTGGFSEETARGMFTSILSEVVDYDWMAGEVVLQDGARS